MAKIAVIINGDTEKRHLDNVERSLKVLEGQGFETYVASTKKPASTHDFYFGASRNEVQKLINQIKQQMGVNDELVIYTTGHGTQKGVCLTGGCETSDIFVQLDNLPYAKRVVVMDQCYGGNFSKKFLDDPKSLFISPGSEQETVCCHEFAPNFWNVTIPDLNNDAVISWQERYAYAVSEKKLSSHPHFVPSPGFVQDGKAAFSKGILKISRKSQLDKALKKLKPGQYAIMLFSAPKGQCGPCISYKPKFKKQAKDSGGQHLWLMTENMDLAHKYNITEYPTVMIFHANGNKWTAYNRNRVLKELSRYSQYHLQLIEKLSAKIDDVKKIKSEKKRAGALIKIANSITETDLKDKAIPVFKKTVAATEKIGDERLRANVLTAIADSLVAVNLKDKALPVLEKAIAAAEKIGDELNRADALRAIAYSLTKTDLKDKAMPVFEKTVAATEKIGDEFLRAAVFRTIADSLVAVNLKNKALPVFEKAIAAAEKIVDRRIQAHSLKYILETLVNANFNDKALLVSEKAMDSTERIRSPLQRIALFADIGSCLSSAGFKDKALVLFQIIIPAAEKLWNRNARMTAFIKIANSLVTAEFKHKALPMFEKAITAAEKIGNDDARSLTLEHIALDLELANFEKRAQQLRKRLPRKIPTRAEMEFFGAF